MKLLRYGPKNQEKPGLLDEDKNIRDLTGIIPDISPESISDDFFQKIKSLNFSKLPKVPSDVRLGSCLSHLHNFLCIGLNYKDHAEETGKSIPTEPVLFSKVTSAVSGPYDDIIIPRHSTKTDWEVELGVIIGKSGKYIKEKDAMNYVAGFCVVNDVSERSFQMERAGQWMKGKSCDSFGPIGPWFVTKDEIPDVQNLEIWCEVDRERKQHSNTKEMIFSVAYLVSYLSQFFTLQPGCLIATGTPAGVGLGQKPEPVFLKPGQVVRLGLQGLGIQEHSVIQEVG